MFSPRFKVFYQPNYAAEAAAADRKAALAVVRQAADCCHVEDMRTQKVYDALNRLSECVTPNRHYAFRRFRRALEIDDPFNRSASVALAYEAINRLIGYCPDRK